MTKPMDDVARIAASLSEADIYSVDATFQEATG